MQPQNNWDLIAAHPVCDLIKFSSPMNSLSVSKHYLEQND